MLQQGLRTMWGAWERKPEMVTVTGQWVEFSFFRPQASMVHIAGEFNEWRQGELPMSRGGDGYWGARVKLPAGEFRFRYCADGEWFTDYAAFGVEPSEFGLVSVVRVPSVPVQVQIIAADRRSETAAA